MSSLSRTKRLLFLFAAIALMLPLLAACAGDDDNGDADTTTDPTPVATSAADDDDTDADTDTTPDVDSSPSAAETPDADATGTADDATTPEATPEETGTVETDATADVDSTPDAVGTPGNTGTPDTDSEDDQFGDLADLSADVPNFTLNYTGTFDNTPDDTGATFSSEMEMTLEQSEPDIYHLHFVITGDEAAEIEIWSLSDSTYIAESGGEPIELPGGMAGEIAPMDAMFIVPPVETLEAAEEIGQEDINGRSATHYRVDAEDAALILMSQNVTVSNPEGEMDIWIDDELDFILRMSGDITFENEDGTEGSIQMEYEVTDIDETDDIAAPIS